MARDPFFQVWSDDPQHPLPGDPNAPSVAQQEAMAAAVIAAHAAGSRGPDVGDVLSDVPSSTAPLKVDDMTGIQYLRKRGGLLGGFDYCARVDIPGVLPRLVITPWFASPTSDDRQAGEAAPFLDGQFIARTRAPGVVRLFARDEVGHVLRKKRCRIALRPDADRRTVLELDCAVGNARQCQPAADIVRLCARLARAAVDNGVVFAEQLPDARPPAERVEALVARVTEAVSWVSGPVERVGDGVEARLALEEQPETPSVLRFDLDGRGQCAVYFEGRLLERSERVTRLSPQESFIDRLRGLVDVKVDDAAFDDAWLIEGEPAVVKQLAIHDSLMLRLRAVHASVEVGPQGLIVRVPAVADGDAAVVDVAGAVLTLWRNLGQSARGFGADQT